MEDNLFRIAVVSDIHCRHSAGKGLSEVNTYLTSDIFPTPVNRNPIEALKVKGENKRFECDLLLCPGDITDKSDPQGLITGWNFLEQLAVAFPAKELAATVGNHDIDSHRTVNPEKHSFDLIKRLKNYPTSDTAANTRFWANNYCILEKDDFLLLIINSSFNHTDKEGAKRSQLEATVIEQIKAELQKVDLTKIKICAIHHHPMHHSNIDYRDTDFVDKSDELLLMLDSLDFDICIHGHKHDPRMTYKNSMAVFGAGSFSSTMNIMDIKADNTFHFISIVKGKRKGTIESWIYSPKDGWKQKLDTYFPCNTGFGYRTDITVLSNVIADWFVGTGREVLRFEKVVEAFPDLIYLIPEDQIKLNSKLLTLHNLKLIPELPNTPETVSKLYM